MKVVQFYLFVARQYVLVDKAEIWQSGNWVASRTLLPSFAEHDAQQLCIMLCEAESVVDACGEVNVHLAQYFRAIEAILDRKLASEKGK